MAEEQEPPYGGRDYKKYFEHEQIENERIRRVLEDYAFRIKYHPEESSTKISPETKFSFTGLQLISTIFGIFTFITVVVGFVVTYTNTLHKVDDLETTVKTMQVSIDSLNANINRLNTTLQIQQIEVNQH